MSNIKLSKVQKSILLQMRIGGVIMEDDKNASIFGATVAADTIKSLEKNKLIRPVIDKIGKNWFKNYYLTELGKTIKL